MHRSPLKLLLIGLLLVNARRAIADQSAVLLLGDKDYFNGELQDSDEADLFRWQSPFAMAPFDFPVDRVSAVHFPPLEKMQAPAGEYVLELSAGDRLFGSLLGITADKIEFDAPPFGKLHIERDQVVRIIRRSASRDSVYLGPNGLVGWKQPEEDANWREEAGHILSDQTAAAIRLPCEIPEQASIEFELSWKQKPDFVLTIGSSLEQNAEPPVFIRQAARAQRPATVDKKARTTGYRFEVWENSLVVVREDEYDADVEVVALLESEGRLHLRVFLDQKSGHLSVYSLEGKRLAEIAVPTTKAAAAIDLRNKTGDIRLEQLAINSWDGQLPAEVSLSESNVQMTDGAVVYGETTAFDGSANEFVVATKEGEQRLASESVSTLLISPQPNLPTGPLRAVLHSGASVTGTLTAVVDRNLQFSRDGIDSTLVIPLTSIRSLLGPGKLNLTPPEGIRVGRLEMEGIRSHGWLVDGTSDAAATCLVWHPRQGNSSSPLRSGLSGRLVYRDPPPPKPKATRVPGQRRQPPQARPGVWGGVLDAFGVRNNPQLEPPTKPATTQSLIHLRGGDKVPCQVTSVDEDGVHLNSSVVEAKFIPHDQIKAIELATGMQPPQLDEKKRQRLLTLPRMQRNNPPTHLLIATNGDVLRGRLQEMSEETVAVEIHLETRDLARDQVASIIWLHKNELADVTSEKPPSESEITLLQALRPDGIRLTFSPHEMIDNALVGTSEVLGACRVDLQTVDMLLIGSMIQQAADELEYHTWKLTHAADPKYLAEDADSGSSPAAPASGLVGQPAPEVKLNLVSGKPFLLSKEKGHIVVLDFWASWCGPCMQAMPMVDEVVREFESQGVKLIAVNMQEDAETVKGALERLKLDSTVVLDVDGATAEKYQVSAIPQTVVIDAQGNVAKLFVGGGPQLGEQLRVTLQELTSSSDQTQ